MVRAAALGIERETSLGNSSHEHFIARLQSVEQRSEIAGRNEFEEELEFALVRRRHDGVGTLPVFVGSFQAESCILAGSELEFSAGLEADHPQLGSDVHAFG